MKLLLSPIAKISRLLILYAEAITRKAKNLESEITQPYSGLLSATASNWFRRCKQCKQFPNLKKVKIPLEIFQRRYRRDDCQSVQCKMVLPANHAMGGVRFEQRTYMFYQTYCKFVIVKCAE